MATLGTRYSTSLAGLKPMTPYVITVTAMSMFGDATESWPIHAVLTGENTLLQVVLYIPYLIRNACSKNFICSTLIKLCL